MKRLAMLLGLALPVFCFSQPLTVQTVFDFNVGDVIYKEYSCTNGTSMFDSVTAKTFSPGNDTIIYYFTRIQKSVNIGQQSVTTTYGTYSLMVTNLTSTLYPPAQISQDTVRTDTSFIGYCGKKVYAYKYKCVTPCPLLSINEMHYLFFYIEGLGGPYKYSQITGAQPGTQQCNYVADVKYWKKGGISCGNRPNMTGIKDHSTENADIVVYPNPAKDEVFIKSSVSSPETLTLELFTITGQKVKENKMNGSYKMDLKDLSGGIYFLKIAGTHFFTTRKIVVE